MTNVPIGIHNNNNDDDNTCHTNHTNHHYHHNITNPTNNTKTPPPSFISFMIHSIYNKIIHIRDMIYMMYRIFFILKNDNNNHNHDDNMYSYYYKRKDNNKNNINYHHRNSFCYHNDTKKMIKNQHSTIISYDIIIAIISTFIITSFIMFHIMFRLNYTTDHNPSYFFERYQSPLESLPFDSSMYDDEEEKLGLERISFNKIYHIPESMATIGDRSNQYVKLRQLYDTKILPKNYNRSIQFVNEHIYNHPNHQSYIQLHNVPIPSYQTTNNTSTTSSSSTSKTDQSYHEYYEAYNINECPYEPPIGKY